MLFRHEISSKNRRKYPLSPDARRQGAFCPGVSDRERYKTRHTVERFFAHIKEHKRLIARFDKLATTFFSFFALACLNVLKHFVNSTIIRSLKPRGVRSKDRRAMNATLIQSAAPVTIKTWEVVEGVSQRLQDARETRAVKGSRRHLVQTRV